MGSAMGGAAGVHLNQASEEELAKVEGLGEERARRLIEKRPFLNWDDLKRVEGFEERLIDDLRRAGAQI
ncbi:MAG TPA: helix-hairpin-helix domain-containing protein [Polyangiaceae bacterium]|nr:helix-hairpin-helix domain-containing protein [Polyangiaceae bacterium]